MTEVEKFAEWLDVTNALRTKENKPPLPAAGAAVLFRDGYPPSVAANFTDAMVQALYNLDRGAKAVIERIAYGESRG